MRKLTVEYPWAVPVLVIAGMLSSLSEGLGIGMFVPFLTVMNGTTQQTTGSHYLDWLNSWLGAVPAHRRILLVGVAMLGCIIFKNLVVYLASRISSWLTQRIVHTLRSSAHSELCRMSLVSLEGYGSGVLLNLLLNQTGRAAQAITTLNSLIATICYCLVFMILLALVSWKLTLLVFGLLWVVSLMSSRLGNWAHQAGGVLAERQGKLNHYLQETIDGAREIRSSARGAYIHDRFVNKSNELADISFRIDMASAAVSPITEVLATVVLCSILFVAAPLASSNYTAEFAKLMAFIIMLYRVQPQLKALQTARVIFRSCAQAVEELSDFITQTTSKYMPEGTKKFAKLEQKIQVESVSFAYPSSSGHAIHDINLVIPANRTTALVGPSGAGKTTLANLLVRFYDPSGGTILVDGEDLRSFTLDSWHRNVGIVSQNIYLFDGTVEENIAFGRPDATAAEVIEAAKLSNAHDFIMELPSGYKTELGERGMRLSGGQRQRIALARALLKKPALLILDEATSALDSFSESLVQEALASLKHRQTILVIAHRMSTIQQADSIAVIDEGGLVEVGTPAELRTVDGIYARLCDMQFSAGDPVGVGRDTAI